MSSLNIIYWGALPGVLLCMCRGSSWMDKRIAHLSYLLGDTHTHTFLFLIALNCQFTEHSLGCGQNFNYRKHGLTTRSQLDPVSRSQLDPNYIPWVAAKVCLLVEDLKSQEYSMLVFHFLVSFSFLTATCTPWVDENPSIWLTVPAPWWMTGWRTHHRKSFWSTQQNKPQSKQASKHTKQNLSYWTSTRVLYKLNKMQL